MLAKGVMSMRNKLRMTGNNYQTFRGLSEKWKRAAEYCVFLPNVLYGVHKGYTFAMVLLLKSQKTIVERMTFYSADARMLTTDYVSMRAKNAAMWKDVFMEDIEG